MGIPSYFKYIITNYEAIFKKKIEVGKIDNLYIDSNSIIYDCLRNIPVDKETNKETFENNLYNKILETIVGYVKNTKPRKRVFVALDGVVPYAKIEQQRQRRYKSALTRKIQEEYTRKFEQCILDNYDKTDEKIKDVFKEKMSEGSNVFKWDQTAITPGTKFMNGLDEFLNDKLVDLLSDNTEDNKFKIMFSGSNEPGEGEHKIFEYMRNNDHSKDNTCVYGLDADLIMLSLNHLEYSRNIFLSRERPSFGDELNEIYDENELMYMSINNLAENIVDKMTNSDFLNKPQKVNKLQDYIFISFLLGNDFMPHFPSLNIRMNGIDTLFNYYKNTFNSNRNIIQNKKIVWKNLKLFLEKLAKDENEMIKENTQKQIKEEINRNKNEVYQEVPYKVANSLFVDMKNCNDNKSQMHKIIDTYKKKYLERQMYNFSLMPSRNRTKEEYINPCKDKWQQRYYYSLMNIDKKFIKGIDEKNNHEYNNTIKTISINYLEGLEWCFEYYNFKCKNTKWKYNFSYPPLLTDLCKYVPIFNTEFLKKENSFVNTTTQLAYVIPRTSFHLLENNTIEILERKYKYNYEMTHKLCWAYCKYLWEAHIEFPYVNLDIFSEYVR